MKEKMKGRAVVLWAVIAAVLIVAIVATVILLTDGISFGGQDEVLSYELYYNVDREKYAGQSFTGRSSREPNADGTYTVRFFKDGALMELTVADRRTVNELDSQLLMGLEMDDDGIVTGYVSIEDMPCKKYAWNFVVKSIGGRKVIVNSSPRFDGMDLEFDIPEGFAVYDMSECAEQPGQAGELQKNDRVIGIKNQAGEMTHLFISQRKGVDQTNRKMCEHCGEEVTWKNWYYTDSLPTQTGHYYLEQDVYVEKQTSIPEDQQICLDLNGKTVTGQENIRIYSLHSPNTRLALFDSSEEQTGKLVAKGNKCDQGVCVWVRYGRFDMYGGTLDATQAYSHLRGVAVSVSEKTAFYLHDGTIMGGTSQTTYDAVKKSYSGGNGGAIAVYGMFVMEDGLITGGKAESYLNEGKYVSGDGGNMFVSGGNVTINGGVIENGTADGSGGNICVLSGSTLTVNNCLITGGTCLLPGKSGGNVYINAGATFNFSDGQIIGGTTCNYGGNVYLGGTMNMSGGLVDRGTILDAKTGKSKDDHPAKNMHIVNGILNMSGGEITGYVAAGDTKKDDGRQPEINLSGTARIFGAAKGHNNLELNMDSNDGVKLTAGTFTKGAKIGVTVSGKFSAKTSAANVAYFSSDIPGGGIVHYDGCLWVGKLGCLCGSSDGNHIGQCNGKKVAWGAWGKTDSLPNVGGYYYLTGDVMPKAQSYVKENSTVYLDLNGKTVSRKDARLFVIKEKNSHLVLTDGSADKTGTLKLTDCKNGEAGMLLNVSEKGNSITMYGGNVDASNIQASKGAAVNVAGTFIMHGGTIQGGTVTDSGGAVRVLSEFVMNGGSIQGGNANLGGAIVVQSKGSFTLNGGTVSGGTATQHGGNIYGSSGAMVCIAGGEVKDGVANGNGGNIFTAGGQLQISGGTITGGACVRKEVANKDFMYANVQASNTAVQLSGGTVDGGITVSASKENGSSVTMTGKPVINGGESGKNGLYLTGDKDAFIPVIAVEQMQDDASILLSKIGSNDYGFFSGKTGQENGQYFISASGLPVTYIDEKLTVGVRKYCVCAAQDGAEHIIGCDEQPLYWTPWTPVSKIPTTSGNYYLTADVALKSGMRLEQAETVRLDLNGHRVSTENTRLLLVNHEDAKLVLTDSNKTGILTVNSYDGQDQGMVLNVSSGEAVMFGGTLDATNVKANKGSAVNVAGTFTLNGGLIHGGTANLGGAVRVYGQFVVNGGIIQDGKAATGGGNVYIEPSGSLSVNGGQILNGSAVDGGSGGNVDAYGVVTMTGGTLAGGTAVRGGNIRVRKSFEMSGGSLIDGKANLGGNVYVDISFTMSGEAVMSGGSYRTGDPSTSGNVYLYTANSVLEVNGCMIPGDVYAANWKSIVLKGDAGVTVGQKNGLLLGTAGTQPVDMTGLTEQGSLLMTLEISAAVPVTRPIAWISDPAQLEQLTTTHTDYYEKTTEVFQDGTETVAYYEVSLTGERWRCECGGKAVGVGDHICQDQLWTAWDCAANGNKLPSVSGYYYLTSSLTNASGTTIKSAQQIHLDLNGHTVGAITRILHLEHKDAVFTITDTSEQGCGKLAPTSTNYDTGYGIRIISGTVNMYAGTLDASNVIGARAGAAMYIAGADATLNLYGGTIKGGTVKVNNGQSAAFAGTGGAICMTSGQLNLHGGTVSGGVAMKNGVNSGSMGGGGTLYIGGGTVNMTGGEITGGKAISSLISGTSAGGFGGCVLVNGGSFTMTGGSVYGGENLAEEGAAPGQGADLAVLQGTVSITGGTVNNENIYVGGGQVTVSPQTVAIVKKKDEV